MRLPLGVRLAVLALVTLAVLGGAELWARGKAPQLPAWHDRASDSVLMAGHSTRLWGMNPGLKQNAGAVAHINALGLRGELPVVPRPPGRQRVMILGDSSFFGHGVSDEQTLAVQLERWLQDHDVDADVVNGAVSGYSVAQSAVMMREVGWDLQPTLLLFANLWSDNTWDTFYDEDLLRSRQLAEHNVLVRSAAFRLLVTELSDLFPSPRGRIVTWSKLDAWPEGKVRRVPLQRYAAIMDELVQEGRSRGCGAAYIRPTNVFLLDPPTTGPAPTWTLYMDAMSALAAHHDQVAIDLTPAFRAKHAQGEAPDALFLDLMHPTAEGQALMAQVIGQSLLDAGWPGRDLVGKATPFPAEQLQDVAVAFVSDDAGMGSPQRWLFDGGWGRDSPNAQVSPDQQRPEGPPPGQAPDQRPGGGDCEGWSLSGRLLGVTGRASVDVRDPEGRTVATVHLDGPGEFVVPQCLTFHKGTLHVTTPDGRQKALEINQHTPFVQIAL